MKYLNYPIEELESNGGYNTAKEICSQPDLWERTYNKMLVEKDQVLDFLKSFWQNESPCVILAGAGTSAFIGEVLVGAFQKEWGVSCRAIGTTDIITQPQNYFIKTRPTLLISFARSGDSPESVATVKLAREYCDNLYELNITCSKDGELVKNILQNEQRSAGFYQNDLWLGFNGNGSPVHNGVYLAELVVRYSDGSKERILRKVAVVR